MAASALKYAFPGHRIQQSNKVHGLACRKQADHLCKDLAVLAGIEHLRAEKFHQLRNNVRLKQRRAQHRLLRLHIVRQVHAHAFQVQLCAARAAQPLFGHGQFISSTFTLKAAVTLVCSRTVAL